MRQFSRVGSRALRAAGVTVGVIWASPISAVGVGIGLLAVVGGARVRWSDAALVFQHVPFGPGGALTLGNVILHTGGSLDVQALTYHCASHGGNDRVRLGDHERAHVYQYWLLGPLFLPLYFACGGIHVRNRFERAADRYAQTGRGWWPWSRDV